MIDFFRFYFFCQFFVGQGLFDFIFFFEIDVEYFVEFFY